MAEEVEKSPVPRAASHASPAGPTTAPEQPATPQSALPLGEKSKRGLQPSPEKDPKRQRTGGLTPGGELDLEIEKAVVRLQAKANEPVNVGRLWGNFNKRTTRANFDGVLEKLVASGNRGYVISINRGRCISCVDIEGTETRLLYQAIATRNLNFGMDRPYRAGEPREEKKKQPQSFYTEMSNDYWNMPEDFNNPPLRNMGFLWKKLRTYNLQQHFSYADLVDRDRQTQDSRVEAAATMLQLSECRAVAVGNFIIRDSPRDFMDYFI